MIRPTSEDIDAIVDTAKEWPADARDRLIKRLSASDREQSEKRGRVVRGPTAAEVIARFGQPGPGPSDETMQRWINEHKESQGGS